MMSDASVVSALTDLLSQFLAAGGIVLWGIALLTVAMWFLILERACYLLWQFPQTFSAEMARWLARSERSSWFAYAIRMQVISALRLKINAHLAMIKTCIALCPLLGLLGTITGMIDVFSVLSLTGGSDVKALAAGVSRATIPTMAGMVAALSGVFAHIYLQIRASRESAWVEERLLMEHTHAA